MKIDQQPCAERQEALVQQFSALPDEKSRYDLLIKMGRDLALAGKKNLMQPQYLVKGCQSEVYLRTSFIDEKVFFECYTEALISAGLVALLFTIYQGEHPDTILTCQPTCFEKMGIHTSLTPGRANGLSSIYLRMKQDALQLLIKK
jgi:sulfur transfer protein SufE